jgi:hypothetical protein
VVRPVIIAADESETARVVRQVGCGVVASPGWPERELLGEVRLERAA